MATLNQDISTLGRALGTVLREQLGEAFLQLVETIRTRTRDLRDSDRDTAEVRPLLASVSLTDAESLVRAFSTYFQLVNIAEEEERVRRISTPGSARKQSIEDAMQLLHAQGVSAEAVMAQCEHTTLGLTFTAHPTEMRRRTVRKHLDAIAQDIARLDDPRTLERVTGHIEALWSTLELQHIRPTVRDEVKAGLHYIDVIAEVLPTLERDLRDAFASVYGRDEALRLPLDLHSWMGGDRDGNPNVTPEVTEETFALHAARAKEMLRHTIEQGYTVLSHHVSRLGTAPQDSSEEEPWRARLAMLHTQIDTVTPEQLTQTLQDVERSLEQAGQRRSARALARPLSVHANVLGTHLVSLDLREHSEKTGAAVAELLTRAGVQHYTRANEQEKRSILVHELQTRRPLLAADETPSPALEWVLAPMRHARAAQKKTGTRAAGRYIVSLSEDVSDLLEVLVLSREVGVHLLPVPLFETLPDLARAPEVMRHALENSVYRTVLGDSVQEIMIGYSDSNKDGGFFAANWALHEAQRRVAAVCREAGVPWRFFHGRGTSIGRGGGPMARGILGQPAGTLGKGLRITEQGEALADKYRHPALAHRSLEQGLYALLIMGSRVDTELSSEFVEAMEHAAHVSYQAYRALIEDPGFLPFFEAVTPIREIARLNIASRPVRRPGPSTLQNLRAIPWVMAWTQNRANVPGWFGLHTGLGAIPTELAQRMYRSWAFFRGMIDNAQASLAKSDTSIFRAYLSLAPAHAHPMGELILQAHADSVSRVQAITGEPLLSSEPWLARSIRLRNPYIDPIHRLQVELLRRARAHSEETLDPQLERALLLSIHGVAAGVRNTG